MRDSWVWSKICCLSRVMPTSKFAALGWFAFAVILVAAGCGGNTEHAEPRACSADAECDSGERCEREALATYPRILIPCQFQACSAEGTCAEGFVCVPGPGPPSACAPRVCKTSCTTTGCPQGQVCRDTGLCAVAQCDEPGVAACPEHWRCDPTAALTEPSVDSGSTIEATLDGLESIARGCVRKQCDEADGHVCREFWSCTPDATMGGSGCVPQSCHDTGHCENDNYICDPTPGLSRPSGNDAFGCVFKHCLEGLVCLAPSISDPSVAYCDPTAANADISGCALRKCDDGNRCVETYVCHPSSPLADRIGCIPGPDSGGSGGSVGNGGTTSSGGSSAGGASSGTAGSSTGGNSTGGSSPGEGRCVER